MFPVFQADSLQIAAQLPLPSNDRALSAAWIAIT
jgi:hypothetical protein